MKSLRNIYPYDLNSRAKNCNEDICIDSFFEPFPRTGECNQRSKLNRNKLQQRADSSENVFNALNNLLSTNLKESFNKIRII